MKQSEIKNIVTNQRKYFNKHETLSIKTRIKTLKLLKKVILDNQEKIAQAIDEDLGKSYFESYMCEIGIVLSEITYMLKHIKKFSKEKTVTTPLAQFASRSFIKPMPYGVVLIMSPWNYPFMLTLDPLVDAIAAGNTVVIKPSAYSPATSAVIKELIEENFPREYIAVITGGRDENTYLLKEKFDYIFFTGSQTVGKDVMKHAAEHLTPVTLELGGKSPCIVEKSANLKLAAKRIVWGKYLNCGQTCVAPDYILCDHSIKPKLVEYLKKEIQKQFGNNPLENNDYGKIINQKHFDRLTKLIDKKKLAHGGNFNKNTLKIEPTIMNNVTFEDNVMQEEIFGPILPIISVNNINDVVDIINNQPHPLAFYVFSENKKFINKAISQCTFGGGCINDTIIHLATSNMGFGGVGESGMGSYHGKFGFDTFSHKKSIVDKKTFMDLPMRYQPFKWINDKLIHMFLR